jgi:hypothetical protein
MFHRSTSFPMIAGFAILALLISTAVNPNVDTWAQEAIGSGIAGSHSPVDIHVPPPGNLGPINSYTPPSSSLPESFHNDGNAGGSIPSNDHDIGGNAGEGDSPPPPPPPSVPMRLYINVACSLNDPSDDCEQDATKALIDEMAEEAASSGSKRMLMVHFGSVLERAEQIKLLVDIENAAVAAMEVKLRGQVRAAAAFQTQQLSPAEAQLAISQDGIAVKRINQEAREQANSGQNWSHDWESSTHTFQSNAYNQLRGQVNISGWGRN